jgi:(E)-4-hydroxy-3-methylbut-2-enyl-diphosphate synthase
MSLPILPSAPAAVPAPAHHQPPPRRRTRRLSVGGVPVGDGAPISVQSMTTTPTHDVNATLQQIAALNAAGVDIVRVACPRQEDADTLAAIAAKSTVPVIADIHFQWKYAMAAIEAGCAGVRINPGNIRKHDKVKVIGDAAKERGIPIRIGVNGGSLEDVVMAKHGGVTPEALVESALNEVRLLEDVDFHDIKISVKHSDPWVMIQTYRLLAERCEYPLHLGVTEAGPPKTGVLKSAVGIGTLLAEGIGDTIRVSLSADPVEEVKAGIGILEALHLRERGLDVVSCPSCGRAEVDVYTLAEQVQAALEGIDVPLRVAVMGCVVNGPGEAREADVGVAAGKGKGQLLYKGQVVGQVPEDQIVTSLLELCEQVAAEIRAERGEGQPTVIA